MPPIGESERIPLHRLAQIMGHDSLHQVVVYVQGARGTLQRVVEKRMWA